ncbi:MAG: hypothetical protein AAF125_16360, partial [Chloroflexota bacterium]
VLTPTKPPALVLVDQIVFPLQNTPILFGMAALGLGVGLRRNDPFVRLIAVVLLVSSVVIAGLYGYYRSYYVAQTVSLFALLTAALLAPVVQAGGERIRIGLAIFLVAGNVGYVANRYMNDEFRENFNATLTVAADLREMLPTGSVVITTDPMYFKLVDHAEVVEYATAGWAAGKFETTEAAIWEQSASDYVVMVYENPERPPASLIDYIETRGMAPTHCWNSARIGQIDLFAPSTDGAGSTARMKPQDCKEID